MASDKEFSLSKNSFRWYMFAKDVDVKNIFVFLCDLVSALGGWQYFY